MLEKILRNVNQGPSESFNGDVFLKTFFPSLTQFYDEHPELREEMNGDFRKGIFNYLRNQTIIFRNQHVSFFKLVAETHTRAVMNVLPEETIFKKPRLEEQSPGDSLSPDRFSESDSDDDVEDDVVNVSFHDFIDHLGSCYSKVTDPFMQIFIALSLIRKVAAGIPHPQDPRPQEWTKQFYGLGSRHRRRLQPKKKYIL